MPGNVYDDPGFFAGYSALPRQARGLDGAPEWPSLRALLPPLAGLDVLDLGCGFGWFCRHARAEGAASALGLDLSARMLARAAEMTRDPAIAYRHADLERPGLPEGAFDLAFSSLALHYVAALGPLLAAVHRALRRGGRLVASMEHPVFTAPPRPGWAADAAGRRIWPLSGYQAEGPREVDWLGARVAKRHRTVASILNAAIGAGFVIRRVEEWAPDAAQLAADPSLAPELDRPTFLLFAAGRG